MPSQFELLLLDVARQSERAANATESTLRRVEQVSRDMFELNQRHSAEISTLSQRVAALEEAKKWTGEERRKVEDRLGSGDHTFAKLQTELELMKMDSVASLSAIRKISVDAARETADLKKAILKRGEKIESRRWAIVKMILQHSIPLIVSGIGTAVSLWIMKGGPK